MTGIVDMGTMSSRGQIAIPSSIRNELGLCEGTKILFLIENDTLLLKKVDAQTFSEITKPFRRARKKINEEDVNDVIHRIRHESNTRH